MERMVGNIHHFHVFTEQIVVSDVARRDFRCRHHIQERSDFFPKLPIVKGLSFVRHIGKFLRLLCLLDFIFARSCSPSTNNAIACNEHRLMNIGHDCTRTNDLPTAIELWDYLIK